MTGQVPEREALLNILENWPKGSDAVVRKSSIDNLKWFIDRINEEIRMIEHQMEMPLKAPTTKSSYRQEIIWLEKIRGIASEALHDKEVAARKWVWMRGFVTGIVTGIVLIVIAMLLEDLWPVWSARPPTPK